MKVKVLLSAYNGVRYIEEQIESILGQTYKDLELIVRDDGSTDGTIDILRSYEEKGFIQLELGKNVGFVASFFWLIEHAGEGDYYFFSDQDDVWFPNKIEMALEKLKNADDSKPVLYFSNYDFYDGDMRFIAHHESNGNKLSFRNSIVDCAPLGFNSCFNKKAYEITIANMPQYSQGHDWWMYMLCSGLGEVIYDDRATVKYRRHNANVSGEEVSFLQFQIWRFKKLFLNGYFKKIQDQIIEFENLFGNQLSKENQKVLALFTKRGFHPINSIKKVFYPKYFRQKLIDEIFLRLVMLIGRL